MILAAGAIGSPRLLMLSGIGPADRLRALGIDVVGRSFPASAPICTTIPWCTRRTRLRSHCPSAITTTARRTRRCAATWLRDCPDLHLFPILLPIAAAGSEPPATGFVLTAAVMAPDSRGSVTLASADPQAPALIDPGLLRDERDLERMETATTIVRELAASPAMAQFRQAEVWPGPGVRTRAGLRTWIRDNVGTYYHPAGTCRMGDGPDAVVNLQLQVRGVTGLRVVDASVMPVIPNAHPNATVLAIAERAAELISS